MSPAQDEFRDALAQRIHMGHKPADIARSMAPGDKTRQKVIRTRVRRMIQRDPDLQRRVGELAQAELVMGLGKASRGLVRAAGRGRSDAVKLLFEATSFHTPRQKHEHSGEIKVKLDIPRPPVLDDTGGPNKEPVVEADVVED